MLIGNHTRKMRRKRTKVEREDITKRRIE